MAASLIDRASGRRVQVQEGDISGPLGEATTPGEAAAGLLEDRYDLGPEVGFGVNRLVPVRHGPSYTDVTGNPADREIHFVPREELLRALRSGAFELAGDREGYEEMSRRHRDWIQTEGAGPTPSEARVGQGRAAEAARAEGREATLAEREAGTQAEAAAGIERAGGGRLGRGATPLVSDTAREIAEALAPATAFGQELVSTATGGLSDVIQRGVMGPEFSEARELLAGGRPEQETLPGGLARLASPASTLAGGVAGAFVPGGLVGRAVGAGARTAGAAAQALRRAPYVSVAGEAPLLTRAAQALGGATTAGAAIGSAQGAREAISNPEPRRAAQEYLSRVAQGATAGLLGEAVFGPFVAIGSAVARGSRVTGQRLQLHAAGGPPEIWRRAQRYEGPAGAGSEAVGRRMNELGITGYRDTAIASRAETVAREAGDDIGRILSSADEVTFQVTAPAAVPGVPPSRMLPGAVTVSAPAEQVLEGVGRAAAQRALSRMDDIVASIAPGEIRAVGMGSARGTLETIVRDARSAIERDPTLRRLHEFRAHLDDIAERRGAWKGREDMATVSPEIRRMRGEIEDEITAGVREAAERAGMPEWGAVYLDAKDRYRVALLAGDAARASITTRRASPVFTSLFGPLSRTIREMRAPTENAVADALSILTGASEARRGWFRSFLAGSARAVSSARIPVTVGSYDLITRGVADRNENRLADQAAVAQGLSDIGQQDPELATQLAETYGRVMDYLATLAPAVGTAGRPSRADQHRLIASTEALLDSNILLDRMRDGTLTRDHVEAVRMVYPDVYVTIERQAREAVDQHDGTVSYAARRMFRVLAGEPERPQLSPSALRIIQSRFAGPQTPPTGQPARSELPSRAATMGQQIGGAR